MPNSGARERVLWLVKGTSRSRSRPAFQTLGSLSQPGITSVSGALIPSSHFCKKRIWSMCQKVSYITLTYEIYIYFSIIISHICLHRLKIFEHIASFLAVEVYVLFLIHKMTANVWITAQNNQHWISQRCDVCAIEHLHCECLNPPNILLHYSRPNAWWFRETSRFKGKGIPLKYMRCAEDFPSSKLWIFIFGQSSMFALARDSVER